MPTSSNVAVVTGSSGFIGGRLCRHLETAGWEVRGIDIRDSRDVLDVYPVLPTFRGATHVFHLAGLADIVPSIERPAEYVETNVMGTVRVLEAARYAKAKFIYAASSSCYGRFVRTPATELDPCYPVYPYAFSKWVGEEAVMHWAAVYQMSACSMRIFNAYGRGMKATDAYGGVFKVFLPQKLYGKPLTIVGDGAQQRDFVHVDDVCRAFILAAEKGEGIYNVGTGFPKSVNHLATLIGGEREYLPARPGEPEITCADIGALKSLGWKPQVPWIDGVGEMIEHIDDWKHAKVWTAEMIAQATKSWMEALA